MAKRNKIKSARPLLKLEALEQRQLLAGGFTAAQGTEYSNIVHPNGNVYDQVLMKTAAISVTADAGQVTRVSFLDLQGDIVQAEFSGAGTLSISLDSSTGPAAPTKYAQPGVMYMSGLASFTIQGSDSTTNFSVFSVGSSTAHGGAANAIFAGGLTGGDHTADISRLTIVADPANPNGSTFGGIRAGNANFAGDTGVVGIAAANVQVQNVVTVGDINATGTATPTLVFGTASQFGSVTLAGGDLLATNGKSVNNTGSYLYSIVLAAGTKSDGTADAAETTLSQLTFTGTNPVQAQVKTFTLTDGVDTIVGTGGDDKIVGTNTTVTGLDSIDGGAGTDSLIINDASTTSAGNPALLTVTGVESLSLTSASGLKAGALDISKWTGLTSAVITTAEIAGATITAASTTDLSVVNSTAQAITIIGGGDSLIAQTGAGAITVGGTAVANNYTSAAIKGGTTVDIRDRTGTSAATGSKLTTVTLDGNTGDATLTSDGLTTLTLANITTADADTTITAAAATRALTVTLNGVTATTGNLADATATSVTLNAITANSSNLTLDAAAATALTINATKNLTLADVNIAAAKTVTITGAGNTTISAATTVTALTTIDAAAATGAVTITPTLGTGVTYTGGAGADKISVAAATKALTTGDGNDTVTLTGAALGTGGSVDAGAGTSDVLSMDSANAATATAGTTFEGTISNFERVTLTGATNQTINLSNLDDISYVSTVGANGMTLNNLGAAGTLSLTGATTAITVNLLDASGTADVFNLMIGGTDATATAYGTVTVAGVETVNIASDDTNATPGGVQHSLTLVDTAAKTIVISGDAGVNLTFAGTALTSFDASAVTKGLVTYDTGALAAASTIKGGAGANTIDFADTTTKAVTYTGGAGIDTIAAGNAAANNITTAAGNDVVTLGSGANTVDLGAGNDTITLGANLNVVTLGAGNDTVNAAVTTNGNSYTTLTDAAAGDTISFVTAGVGATVDEATLGSAITLASTAAFADFLNAATAGNGGTNAIVNWFQYGGDTYVILDNSALSTYASGVDSVIKLTGSVSLSSSTLASEVLTIV